MYCRWYGHPKKRRDDTITTDHYNYPFSGAAADGCTRSVPVLQDEHGEGVRAHARGGGTVEGGGVDAATGFRSQAQLRRPDPQEEGRTEVFRRLRERVSEATARRYTDQKGDECDLTNQEPKKKRAPVTGKYLAALVSRRSSHSSQFGYAPDSRSPDYFVCPMPCSAFFSIAFSSEVPKRFTTKSISKSPHVGQIRSPSMIYMICVSQGKQIPGLYDLYGQQITLSGGRCMICIGYDMIPGLDLYYTDPAQRITMTDLGYISGR